MPSITTLPPITPPPPIRRLLAVVALAAALIGAVVVLTASDSAAEPHRLHTGLGYRLTGGDFVGFYLTRTGLKIYCLEPTKSAPTRVSFSTVERYGQHSGATTSALAYALTEWGDASTRWRAAVESQVVNTIVGNTSAVHRRAAQLPRRLQVTVDAHVQAARRLRGPYSVHVAAPARTPGQSGQGTVRVISAAGYAMAGVAVRLFGSTNIALPRWVRTDADGMSGFGYRVTGIGAVHLSAVAHGLASTAVAISHPRPGHQHMAHWALRVQARATAGFTGHVGGVTNSYACTSTCDGRPRVTLSACAAPSRYDSRLDYHLGARVVSVTYPASATRRCRALHLRLADTQRVTATWRYRIGTRWSAAAPAAGGFTVDCPPVPAVIAAVHYDCADARVDVRLARHDAHGRWSTLINHSGHRVVLVVAGSTSRRIVADQGESARFSASTSCTTPLHLYVRAGVQRADGAYNYGPVATVITPGAAGHRA